MTQMSYIIENEGVKYSYCAAGDAKLPTIILIHGVSGSAEDMLRIAKGLAKKGYRVIMPNLPGHMGSDYIHVTRFSDLADWLNNFLLALKLKKPPVAIVGNSFAAAVCYEYITQHPVSPKTKIFLVVPTPSIALPVKIFQEILLKVPSRFLSYAYDKTLLNHLRLRYILTTRDKTIRTRALESELRKEFLDDRILHYPVLLGKENPFLRYEVDKALQQQIVLLYGEQDNVAGRKSLATLRTLLPYSRMVVVPKSGHIMHFEAEDEYIHHVHSEMAGSSI